VIRITLASNAIQLEAARRLRRHSLSERSAASGGSWGDWRQPCLELLVHEPGRMRLSSEDRRLWPLRCPVRPAVMAALTLPALLGLVGELRFSHLRGAGRALRLLARHARSLCLLDDGLDQYRRQPQAVDPAAFPEGTPCWLFSDAPAFRADWCRRFTCRELGALYAAPDASSAGAGADPDLTEGTLIIDSPGLERLRPRDGELPRPWCLVPHPVRAKRSWTLPMGPADRVLRRPPEQLLPGWRGTVLVGESLMLLAALRLRPGGSPLLIALPGTADANLVRLARTLAAENPAITLL